MAQGIMLHRRRKIVSKAFKTTWNVTVGTLTIPSQTGSYNCVVDWGDGTAPTTHTEGDLVHTYTTAGLHQISITGQYSGFRISANYATRTKLISVDDWGTVGFTSMRDAFQACSNLVSLPAGAITGAENVSDFGSCFSNCTSLTSVPEGLFLNCPNATDFAQCFYNCTFRLPLTMFNYTAIADKQPSMLQAFYSKVSKTGTAYPLWNYITIASRNYCYEKQTLLTNYNDIPANWK